MIAVPKTIYFNFKVLPFKYAIKLPIWVGNNTTFVRINKN